MKVFLQECLVPGGKAVQTRLPGGATECTLSGLHSVLMRVFAVGSQTCVVSAGREREEITRDGRRFVESFTKAK